ncbi:MAG TPA: dihydroorotate dehydrogenase [Phycisphaerae bacterium]|nr:dihydroorotate dehydrogenase [Phycisphaerae bacterium]
MTEPNLEVQIDRLTLKNPVLTASGTCGYGEEYAPFLDLALLGGFTTKSITLKPRPGNEAPRIVETCGGMINAIGLANVGVVEFLKSKLPYIQKMRTAVFVNVAGHSIDEYVAVCRQVDAADGIAGVELNVSCPNVADGLMFGTDAKLLHQLVASVRAVTSRGLLIVKLSPNVTDISELARAAVDAGADALSMVNTFLGMAIDIESWRPKIANESGGLSGPAIKPMAVHLVHKVWRDVAARTRTPIIGIGGISSWQDAVEFMLAGASAVSVGTALYVDPTTPLKIVDGLRAYLARKGIGRAGDLVGKLISAKGSPASEAGGAAG